MKIDEILLSTIVFLFFFFLPSTLFASNSASLLVDFPLSEIIYIFGTFTFGTTLLDIPSDFRSTLNIRILFKYGDVPL